MTRVALPHSRLGEIMAEFGRVRVLVLGDYFLDKYLDIERALAEVSIETGLEAHQVVGVRVSPGAAGTVVSNLCALGVHVAALGVIGDDGNGYELIRGLRERQVDVHALLRARDRCTPTYTKPMMHEPGGRVHELSRLDIKNRSPLPEKLEGELLVRLRELVPTVDGVIVADQVAERNCGVITDRVRDLLANLGDRYPEVAMVADSRLWIGEYRRIMLKPNEHEAVRAIYGCDAQVTSDDQIERAGRALCERTGRPVFITVGERGSLLFSADGLDRIPAVPVTGEIDIVGAGDSTLAGIVAARCSGASLQEAALVGNLVASVTIRCIGTTGTASQDEVTEALGKWQAANAG